MTEGMALPAEILAEVGSLELAARMVVDGARSGTHASLQRGFGTEFVHHRPYRPGDDLRYLDWKLLARTDRLHTRQFRETTNLNLLLVVDSSASMGFPRSPGVSRLRYGALLGAALAWMASGRGDGVGLLSRRGGRTVHMPPRGGRSHLRGLLLQLGALEAESAWRPAEAVALAGRVLRRRSLVLVISDFYDEVEVLRQSLRGVALRGHDVGMMHLVSPSDLAGSGGGEVEFEDAETGERRVVDAEAAAPGIRARMEAFQTEVRRGALRDGIQYTLASTGEPPAVALRRLLLARMSAAAGVPARSAGGAA